MPLIVQRQQHHCILQGTQQHLQQRQHTLDEEIEVEADCTCATTLANNKNTNINTETATTAYCSIKAHTNSNSTTAATFNINNSSRMNQMPFKRNTTTVHNIAKIVAGTKTSTTVMQGHGNTAMPRGISKISEFSSYASGNRTSTETLPPPLPATAAIITPPSSSSSSFFGGTLPSSITKTNSITTAPTSLQTAVTYSTLASATSPLSSMFLYTEVKKYCRRFLIVISLICLLHSCLLWNTAEAAISNRATNIRPLSNSPQTVAGNQPRFLSRGHTYRAVVGDTLVLPCQVENLGNFVLLWRRGINVLTASNIMVTRDERVRLIDGYNLEISDLEPQDAGDYVCQISDKVNRDQVHTVEILVPPSVRATPTSGNLQARKGGPVTMECKGSGNPVPSIYWTKKSGAGKSTARIGDGPILTLEKVERQQAGIYQCTADNGVGEPVSVDIRLDVLYPPDIQVEKSWIHSGEGFEAKLVCIVYADPIASVSWYQNSFLIQSTDRRIMSSRGNRHTLTIRHIQQEDFGNYSCVADNTLGRSRKYMELSGRPGPAEFYSPKWGRSSDSYNLTWKIDSYPPLEEVRLLYRRVMMNDTYQQPGRWHDFILTPEHRPASEPLTHIMSYTIKNLLPGAYYEAIVQAKNRYGWNEVSDIFQFIVASNSMDIPPEESEVVASSKSRSNAAATTQNIPSTVAVMLNSIFLTVSCLYGVRRQFNLG
ncbi:klingon [Musca autumnalis]|uniref:klingon n=1 Tax=Musca autumnalis TaxID=221902 RepID=UPI003CF22132